MTNEPKAATLHPDARAILQLMLVEVRHSTEVGPFGPGWQSRGRKISPSPEGGVCWTVIGQRLERSLRVIFAFCSILGFFWQDDEAGGAH